MVDYKLPAITQYSSKIADMSGPIYLGRGMWSFICTHCNRRYSRLKNRRGKFCSLQCFGKQKVLVDRVTCPSCAGRKAWGSTRCRRCYGKNSQRGAVQPCPQCDKPFYITPGQLACSKRTHGAFCSRACYAKYITGPRNHRYSDGSNATMYPKAYRDMRKATKVRDGHRCFLCQEIGKLDVHHIDRCRKNNEPWNLVTLCRPCHGTQHGETPQETKKLAARMYRRLNAHYGYAMPYITLRLGGITTTLQMEFWSITATT